MHEVTWYVVEIRVVLVHMSNRYLRKVLSLSDLNWDSLLFLPLVLHKFYIL